MPGKIERFLLHEMRHGQSGDFFAVLCERTLKTTRDGKPFYSLKFRDRRRTVTAPLWDNSPLFDACDKEWQVGQHFKIRAAYVEHQKYGPQLEIQNVRHAVEEDWVDGYDPDSFVLASRFDADEMFAELLAGARTIDDEPLRRLVAGLLEKHADNIRRIPAACKHHHSYQAGYLEHTLSVLRTGVYLVEKYRKYYPDLTPPLNRDLVIAGCILHDIGKLEELDCGLEETTFTIPGQLLGHILIGRDLVRDAAQEIAELNADLLLYLEHIIVAHQGTPEWGSPKVPMLPEALIVHYADDLDAKMNMFVAALAAPQGDGPFTEHSAALRRRLLRERTV